MKALSVTQPWASVICSGMKDVENRLWQAAEAPGRILIHATQTKVPSNWEAFPDDYVSVIRNARLMGQIPEYKDMPYGAIIGYVDCYKIVKGSDSFWAQPNSFHWCLKDAYLFDEPIPGIKGVRGHLFDVDIDENNLPPAHKVNLPIPEIQGSNLIMPAGEEIMAMVESGVKEVAYELSVFAEQLFFDPNTGNPYPVKTIEFVGKDKTIKKDVEGIEVGNYTDDKNEPIEYIGFDGQPMQWCYVVVVLK